MALPQYPHLCQWDCFARYLTGRPIAQRRHGAYHQISSISLAVSEHSCLFSFFTASVATLSSIPCALQIYIHRVLKEVHPDLSLSNKAIGVLDGFTKDIRERITLEASQLCRRHNKATLSSREVSTSP